MGTASTRYYSWIYLEVMMWEHGAYFCGACYEFPYEFLKGELAEWDKGGISNLKKPAYKYRNG